MVSIVPVTTNPRRAAAKAQWGPMANGDVGLPENLFAYSNLTVQVKGTFGVGGSVSIEGSNDGGTTWVTLFDNRGAGAALTFTAAGLRSVNDRPLQMRPNVTAGDGTTALTIIINGSSGR